MVIRLFLQFQGYHKISPGHRKSKRGRAVLVAGRRCGAGILGSGSKCWDFPIGDSRKPAEVVIGSNRRV